MIAVIPGLRRSWTHKSSDRTRAAPVRKRALRMGVESLTRSLTVAARRISPTTVKRASAL